MTLLTRRNEKKNENKNDYISTAKSTYHPSNDTLLPKNRKQSKTKQNRLLHSEFPQSVDKAVFLVQCERERERTGRSDVKVVALASCFPATLSIGLFLIKT